MGKNLDSAAKKLDELAVKKMLQQDVVNILKQIEPEKLRHIMSILWIDILAITSLDATLLKNASKDGNEYLKICDEIKKRIGNLSINVYGGQLIFSLMQYLRALERLRNRKATQHINVGMSFLLKNIITPLVSIILSYDRKGDTTENQVGKIREILLSLL